AVNEPFYYGDWIKTPGVAICSCNDGIRPVIFKIEAQK
ncbi:TIGR04076 family protein, partial [bacterium]|nr:TIGR04076 family protein [bacterium]